MLNPETKTAGYRSNGAIPATMHRVAEMPVMAMLVRLVEVLQDWRDRARQRHHLAMLDHHMLRDIGLSSADVEHETDKPCWRS